MKQHVHFSLTVLLATLVLSGFAVDAAEPRDSRKPTLFLIGDSTVNNSTGGLQGWGTPFFGWFEPAKIEVKNRALGGRSSRSFLREGLWTKVLADIKPGDFVLMQFGHNDGGPLDAEKTRASLKGSGAETREVTIKETGAKEVVRTYGGYLRQYVADAKARGATPIVVSPVPRNIWADGKVARADNDYGKWAAEAAKAEGVPFIDLNEIVACRYEEAGEEKVRTEFFTTADHTHTTPAGAALNAECVVEGLRKLTGSPLAKYLLAKPAGAPAAGLDSNR